MARIVITGVPRSGKTSVANALSKAIDTERGIRPVENLHHPVRHTDDLVGKCGWSGASLEAATWLDTPGPWIIEGVTTIRALRKWAWRSPKHLKPCDYIFWAEAPHGPITAEQRTLMKGCQTIWARLYDELAMRGVVVRSIDNAVALSKQYLG